MKTIISRYLEVRQPIGQFYIAVLSAADVIDRVLIAPRRESSPESEDVQRELSGKRVSDIALYITDPDATFPTPIILSVKSSSIEMADGEITFYLSDGANSDNSVNTDMQMLGEVLDGQHRIRGLQRARQEGTELTNFLLPIVIMLDLSPAEKAYVFSIINSKQTPVSKSLIYDLFGLSPNRSPQLTAHEIARAMNIDPSGPFYRGLKMLGKRKSATEMLTQGSFVTGLLSLITKNPDRDRIAARMDAAVPSEPLLPFNEFWRQSKDELILRCMTNYFNAIKQTYPFQWEAENYIRPVDDKQFSSPILRRTVGYEALMRALQLSWPRITSGKNISADFFMQIAQQFRKNVPDAELTTGHFGSSSADAGRLAFMLTAGIRLS